MIKVDLNEVKQEIIDLTKKAKLNTELITNAERDIITLKDQIERKQNIIASHQKDCDSYIEENRVWINDILFWERLIKEREDYEGDNYDKN